jgi:hypothetical protein
LALRLRCRLRPTRRLRRERLRNAQLRSELPLRNVLLRSGPLLNAPLRSELPLRNVLLRSELPLHSGPLLNEQLRSGQLRKGRLGL